MTDGPTPAGWLELALVLGGEVGLLVGAAALLDRLLRSAAWKRILWQACLLGLPLLLFLEVTGASRSVVQLSESVFPAESGRGPDPVPPAPPLAAKRELPARAAAFEPLAVPGGAPAGDGRREAFRSAEESADRRRDPRGSEDVPSMTTGAPAASASVRTAPLGADSPPLQASAPERGGTWWPGFVWLAGAAAMASRRGWGCLLILLLQRRREPGAVRQVEESVQRLAGKLGLRRAVAVRIAPGLSSPIALGLLKPTIILPAGFTGEYAPAHQEVILAHELAHLAGRDPVWLLLADLAVASLWWHPLAWWARERLIRASEMVADEASVLLEDGPLNLATCLVALGQRKSELARAATGIRGSGFRSSLGHRVERLLGLGRGSWRPPGGIRTWMVRTLGLSLVVSLMAFSLAWARPQAQEWPGQGGQEMEVMMRSFKRSLAGMALLAVLGIGSDRTLSQDGGAGEPLATPLVLQEAPAGSPQEASEDPATSKEDSDAGLPSRKRSRSRAGNGPKDGNLTIEAQVLRHLEAISKRLDAMEDELAQKRGSDESSSVFHPRENGLKQQSKFLDDIHRQALKEAETKRADHEEALALLLSRMTAGSGADTAKWEYKVVSVTDLGKGPTMVLRGESHDLEALREHALALERALNQLGQQGWELFSVTQTHYLFKRPAQASGTGARH